MPPTRTPSSLLREIRARRGESLRAAAEALGVAPSHLSRLERGEAGASDELLARASAYYHVGLDELEASTGGAPEDVVAILRSHPELWDELRKRYGDRS